MNVQTACKPPQKMAEKGMVDLSVNLADTQRSGGFTPAGVENSRYFPLCDESNGETASTPDSRRAGGRA